MGVLITELRKRLLSERDNTSDPCRNAACCSVTVAPSQLNMLLKSDCKEPPVFRGEPTDKCLVQEWIDLMSIFLKKKRVNISDQLEEILSKLMGRARDVVRIGLHSDSSTVDSDVIFYLETTFQ